MPRLFLTCLWLLLVATLTACVSHSSRSPNGPLSESPWRTDTTFFTNQAAYYGGLSKWRYSAKVGVTTPQGRDQASMDWTFADQANSIRLYGPLGLGAVRIEFDDYGVVLSDNKGVRHRGDSVQTLLNRIVGWPIPVDALSKWLFLLPEEGAKFRYRLDQQARLQILEQNGWHIEYADYKQFDGQDMPRKITATRLDATAGDDRNGSDEAGVVKVRLISKRWQW